MDKTTPSARIPRRVWLVLGLVLALLVIAEVGAELWYRWHEARATVNPSWAFRWPDANSSPANVRNFRELPVAGQELLHFDRARGATWSDGQAQWVVMVIEWDPGKKVSAMDSRHNPVICLPSTGFELVREIGGVRVPTSAGDLTFRGYEFRQGGRTPWVFSTSIRPLDLPEPVFRAGRLERRITQFERAVFGNRQSPERILLVAIDGPRTQAEAEQTLRRIAPTWVHRLDLESKQEG